jgi:hypothetical protein
VVAVHDDLVLKHDGAGAEAVLAGEQTRTHLPELFAAEIMRGDDHGALRHLAFADDAAAVGLARGLGLGVVEEGGEDALPSVAGVLEAWLLRRWMLSMGALTTFDCQSSLPVARSRQSSTRCSVSATAATMNMRSCHTIGDAWPLPGSSAFHVTLPSAEIGKPLSG